MLNAEHASIRGFVFCVLGFAFLFLTSCGKSESAGVQELFIVTPHGSDIRREFEGAFSKWHQAKYGSAVKIQWPDIGGNGTQNIIRALDAEYAVHQTSGYDLIWGGGSATFNQFASHDYLRRPDVPEAVLSHVPADIFGTPLHAKGDIWIAATMSYFGMVINKDRIGELGLETPRVWADLAGPGWIGCLSLGDPSKGGSVRTSYEMVLQQYGWEKGWALLTEMFANANVVRDVSSTPADDVGSAQAVGGIVIDFFGRKQVIRVGPTLLGFVVPEGGSTIDPDPIAMLKGAPHAGLAAHFIEFVESPEGQKLWVFRAGTPGGPERSALGRMTVLPELYKDDGQYMLDPADPFASKSHLKLDVPAEVARTVFLGDLMKSCMIDNYHALVAARVAVKGAGDPADLLAELGDVPTFVTSSLDGSGKIVESAEIKMTGDLSVQQAVAEAYRPGDSSPLKGQGERLQTRLKELWRTRAAERYARILGEARGRR